ncbi:MAG: hypothetical protein SCM88_02565 [Bacillota bacterium]|nr:hypothetical protein [Bacillota bacterium]
MNMWVVFDAYEVIKRIDMFNRFFDIAVFNDLDCSCKQDWEKAMEERNKRSIPDRIRDQLAAIIR